MFLTHKFGQLVRNKREIRRMSLEKAAEKCELSTRGLQLIEFGTSDPKLSTVLQIAHVFDIDLGDLNGYPQVTKKID